MAWSNCRNFLRKICILIFSCHFVVSANQIQHRPKRGASIYPVFGGGSAGHYGGTQNSHFLLNDPTSFIQYLGGSTGQSRGHSSASSPSSSTYSYTVVQPTSHGNSRSTSSGSSGYSGNSGSSFDTNHLNAYTLSQNHSPSPSSTSAPSTNGWTPIVGRSSGSNSHSSSSRPSSSSSSSGSLGYGGSFYTSHYGLLSPNFAQSNSLSSGSSHRAVHVPRLDANVLANAAQTSFYAQNNLYDVLLSGSRPSTYKGSSY